MNTSGLEPLREYSKLPISWKVEDRYRNASIDSRDGYVNFTLAA